MNVEGPVSNMKMDELEKLWGMDSSNSGLDATSEKSDHPRDDQDVDLIDNGGLSKLHLTVTDDDDEDGNEDEDDDPEEEEDSDEDMEDGEAEDTEINDDEAISGSPDASLPLSDRDDLDAYENTDHLQTYDSEDDDDNENNLSDSINLEEFQTIHSSSQYDNGVEVAATSSDPANITKIAYVKGNIRK